MNKNKIIKNKFESWGKGKREIPLDNDVLKREILSRFSPRQNERVFYKHSPLFWLPFVFTTMAVFVIFINITGYFGGIDKQNGIYFGSGTGSLPTSGVYDKATIPTVMPYYREESISDKREFLKIDYNATLRTREVSNIKTKIEIAIRALGGRVDSSNNEDKNGYINFVIPKDNLESFKIEIKDLVGERFYNEQIYSQNLLLEKQSIEESQKQTETQLSNSQNEYAQIIGNHNKNISIFQGQIIFKNTEINALNIEYQYTTAIRRAEITNRINQLQTEINAIQSEIENENRDYKERINNINLQIKNTQENLKIVKQRDNNFIDNIATVNGSISLNWISLWEIVDIYLPGPLLAWIFFLAAFITFFWYRYSMRIPYNSFDFS